MGRDCTYILEATAPAQAGDAVRRPNPFAGRAVDEFSRGTSTILPHETPGGIHPNITDMSRLCPSGSKRVEGFSLIEVLIALMILSVGSLGIAAMMALSLQNKNNAYSRAQASDLAYSILDRMRANHATAIQHGYDIALGAAPVNPPSDSCIGIAADCSPKQIADLDLAQWKHGLAAILPSGDGSIRTAALDQMTEVTITIQWNDRRSGQAAETANGTAAPAAATVSFVVSSGL
jgi:type IV pilus assembly protein PilV